MLRRFAERLIGPISALPTSLLEAARCYVPYSPNVGEEAFWDERHMNTSLSLHCGVFPGRQASLICELEEDWLFAVQEGQHARELIRR